MKDFIIKNGVLEAYEGTGSEAFVPEGVRKIGDLAFGGCRTLEYIELPQSVKKLGYRVFGGCGAAIYAPSVDLFSLDEAPLKRQFAMGFVRKRASGAEINGDMEDTYRKYIKSQKKRFYDRALEDIDLLSYLTDENIIPQSDIEALAKKADNADIQIKTILLTYQNKIITPEIREKTESEKITAAVTGVLTAAQAKKEWKYEKTEEGNIRLTGYTGSESCIAVPLAIGKSTVSEIGEYAFSPEGPNLRKVTSQARKQIKSVIFSGNIKKIGSSAFEGCDSLTDIDIPEEVEEIGSGVFDGCRSLRKVFIPQGIKSIGQFAFRGCQDLADIDLPESLTFMEEGAFRRCESLGSIDIPQGVREIGENAFENCRRLMSVSIPASLIHIGENAFGGCGRLSDITISEDNPVYRSEGGSIYMGDTLFAMPSAHGRTVIPEGVKAIGSSAFSGCEKLTYIVIPQGVEEIGHKAFYACVSLRDTVIPESVGKIGGWAFSGCLSLENAVIPQSVTEIGEGAFVGCSSLKSIVIPESVSSIGEWVFAGCSDNLVICGKEGSCAEKYARENNIKFKAE